MSPEEESVVMQDCEVLALRLSSLASLRIPRASSNPLAVFALLGGESRLAIVAQVRFLGVLKLSQILNSSSVTQQV